MWRPWSQTGTEDLLEDESTWVRCRTKPLPSAGVTSWGQGQGAAKCSKRSGKTWLVPANTGAMESWKKTWDWWQHPPSRVGPCSVNVLPWSFCKGGKISICIQRRGTHFFSQVGQYNKNEAGHCYLISHIALPVFKNASGELHQWFLVQLSHLNALK